MDRGQQGWEARLGVQNLTPTLVPQGFKYSWVSGHCCGECVQVACPTPDGRLVQVRGLCLSPNQETPSALLTQPPLSRISAQRDLGQQPGGQLH